MAPAVQEYRKVWEELPEFKGWLSDVPGDALHAYCKWCDKKLKAHKRTLLDHKKSRQHIILDKSQSDVCEQDVGHGWSWCWLHDSNLNLTNEKQLKTAEPKATLASSTSEENCHTLAGNPLYPNTIITEGRTPGHNSQWTKALIRRPAPDWIATAVIDGQFKQLKLSDYRGKYLVFFFYTLDFTFVCPTEIIAFNDRINEFRALNTEVVACSIDSHFTHLAWTKTPKKEGGLGKLNIPLLSDLTHTIAKDYGVYLEDQGVALRGLFIIDDKGILRQITMNDLPVGRSVEETLRLVQAFQLTDQHGEVCPAEWKPGDVTIIPTPDESRKYFMEANEK